MSKLLSLFFLLFSFNALADELKITTWNIETLGAHEGRGFAGGFGRGNLPLRSDEQINAISSLIKYELLSDIIAVQEILITHTLEDGTSRNFQLDKIVNQLGEGWEYYLPPKESAGDSETMFLGFIWNSDKFDDVRINPMRLENQYMAGKSLFDRIPLVGYFDIKHSDGEGNDFVLVNVHMGSGQHNDENHLIAMTLIEYELTNDMLENHIKESDRIILGDFNDNPYALSDAGNKAYSSALYVHMEFKKYKNFVTADLGSTRMDSALKSTIDHILINSSAQRHTISEKAEIYRPLGGSTAYAEWRKTYSDHFPVSIILDISSSDDDVDF